MLRIKTVPFLFRNSTPKYLSEHYNVEHHYGIAILNVIDQENIVISQVNKDFSNLLGQDITKLIALNLYDNPLWQDDGQLWQAICLCLNSHKTQVINWSLARYDIRQSINCSIIPTFAQSPKVETLTLIVTNNSADTAFSKQIQQFNYYDKLTGLPNQNYLNEVIEEKIFENDPNGETAILLINILQFQRINESFGYELGDKIIQKISYKLENILPPKALLTRFNGDKFSILLTDGESGKLQKEAEMLAKQLHHDMALPIETGTTTIHLSLTIGIALCNNSIKEGNMLVQHAHIAMQRLNKTSRDKTLIYRPELQTRANSRLKMENELRDALKNKELNFNYQPIINLQNGHLIAFEALCRWNHPERGMVSPTEFIPLAEESGLIVPLGNWALREACRSLKILTDKNPNFSNIAMNVNVSGSQLLQDNFVAIIHEALLNAGLEGHRLKLEITETTLIENAEVARDILLDLKALGVALAIDDFGTGYSSLSYLNQFPIDTLKIDKSFVNRMNATKDSYKIIHVISTLAQTLGMNLVAEGIEHEDQLLALKKLGCQTGQGYLFSKPLSFTDTENYIRKESTALV